MNKIAAQKFMNQHGIKICWECDGIFYKHKENAEARSLVTKKEFTEHELSAGVQTEKPEEAAQ